VWLRKERGILDMEIHYTTHLLYGKYAYKLVFAILTPSRWPDWRREKGTDKVYQVLNWINANYPNLDFKHTKRYQWCQDSTQKDKYLYHAVVYLDDPTVVDALVAKFKKKVIEQWRPMDKEHREDMGIRNIIEIRDSLIFKKFRYAIYFHYDKSRELFGQLEDYFQDNKQAKVAGNCWWPKLYLNDKDDVTAIKLMWGENISHMKSVRLTTEEASVLR
jgi:hypothetical protein